MGKVRGFILTIVGIPLLLFGMLILFGLTVAGIIGMAFIIPAIIFASILLSTGTFLIILGIRDYASNKRTSGFNDIHGNSYKDNNESNKGIGNKIKIHHISFVAVLVLVTMSIFLTVQPWNQTLISSSSKSSETKEISINNNILPLANGTLIVANDGNTFNSTNPDITIDSNSLSKFVVVNHDSTLHDFKIDSLGIHSPILKVGDSYEFVVQDSKPGVYEYLCTIHPNKMQGVLTVK